MFIRVLGLKIVLCFQRGMPIKQSLALFLLSFLVSFNVFSQILVILFYQN